MKSIAKFLKSYRLEIVAVVAGAVVMIFELVGARMVAPYFGTSLYVWTAIIGVILGALSAGYWYGGKLADRNATYEGLMKIIVLAAILILAAVFTQQWVLSLTAQLVDDVRVSALMASLVLFAPASLLLGVVSPYVVRLKLASLETAGAEVGRLYAAGTFGSIAGTFLAGFWLIAWFGNRNLGLLLVVVLALLSFIATPYRWWMQRSIVLLLAVGGLAVTSSPVGLNVIADVDSAYSRYQVTESFQDEGIVRSLVTDPFSSQSAQVVGDPDRLVFDYTRRFMEVVHEERPDDILVIGGGTFTFPFAAARAYPETAVTAVEIDPVLTPLAEQYFSLENRENLMIVNADGRVFLNQNQSDKRYDIVFMDAFSSLTPPYQLATKEAVSRVAATLNKDGVAVVNIVSRVEESAYLAAIMTTYREQFSYVRIYQLAPGLSTAVNQNLLIFASHDQRRMQKLESALSLSPLAVPSSTALTDDHAPLEQLINQQ